MEPFLFRSFYYCVKGQARDIFELESEMRRLNEIDPGCVRWHLTEEHISRWLLYVGEKRLSDRLSSVSQVKDAVSILARTTSRRKTTKKSSGRGTPRQ